MPDKVRKERTPATEADIEAYTVGGARRPEGAVYLAEYDAKCPELFIREAERIKRVLGDTAMGIEHVGSASVPGLAANPIIDIVLEATDSGDEPTYVTRLESHGYRLRIREPAWWKHRMLKGPDTFP